jgi:hypothetical protein
MVSLLPRVANAALPLPPDGRRNPICVVDSKAGDCVTFRGCRMKIPTQGQVGMAYTKLSRPEWHAQTSNRLRRPRDYRWIDLSSSEGGLDVLLKLLPAQNDAELISVIEVFEYPILTRKELHAINCSA